MELLQKKFLRRVRFNQVKVVKVGIRNIGFDGNETYEVNC